MKKHWFVPFSVGAMFTAFVLSAPFFRGKTLQSSGYILGALFGSTHMTGDFLLTTGTIVLIFISLFLAVAQERNQFIDRLALQPARIQIPAYVLAFLALELFPGDGSGAVCVFPVLSGGYEVGLTGLEPVTLRLSSACSNQLSYRPGSAAEPPDV